MVPKSYDCFLNDVILFSIFQMSLAQSWGTDISSYNYILHFLEIVAHLEWL